MEQALHAAVWDVGGMTDWTSRKLSVPLHFLASGRYETRLYLDGSMSEDGPNAIRVVSKGVKRDTALPVAMAPGGGFAAIIAPK